MQGLSGLEAILWSEGGQELRGCPAVGRTEGPGANYFSSQAHGAPVAQLDRASGYESFLVCVYHVLVSL